MHIRHRHALSIAALLLPFTPCAYAEDYDDSLGTWFKNALKGGELTVVAPPPEPSAWRAFNDQFYRVESDGNFSCYSEDGVNCKRGDPAPGTARIRPLVCGLDHRAKYGITGYDTAGHWCNVAHANLFADWQSYHFLGYPTFLAVNANGDPMCLSTDNTNCRRDWTSTARPDVGTVRPLVCGKAHRSSWGISGYEAAHTGHWCQTPSLVGKLDRRFVSGQDVDRLTLDLPAWTAADRPTFHIWAFSAQSPQVTLADGDGRQWRSAYKGPHPEDRSLAMVFDFSEGDQDRIVYKAGAFPRALRFDQIPVAIDQFWRPSVSTAPNQLTMMLPGQQQLSGQQAEVEPALRVWITKPRATPKL
ncbi:hypothetical protein CDL60_01060 [Roseateles noduli]|nr:hypothetical protein CDL60_01060 [Roseateles noduli]